MSTLSDMLGIGHFTISSGGTVRREFIEAVARGPWVRRMRTSSAHLTIA